MEVSEIVNEVRDVFDPLAGRLDLSGPVQMSLATTEFSLIYSGRSLAVEVSIDMSQFFIHVLLFRPSDSGISVDYNKQVYLQQALEALSVNVEQETRSLRKLGGNHLNCKAMAKLQAELLERYWSLLCDNTENGKGISQ
jgi:hypothetical protein